MVGCIDLSLMVQVGNTLAVRLVGDSLRKCCSSHTGPRYACVGPMAWRGLLADEHGLDEKLLSERRSLIGDHVRRAQKR